MNKAPCKGCPNRTVHPNCHGACQDYKNFVNLRAKYHEERKNGSIIAEYIKQKREKDRKKVNLRG